MTRALTFEKLSALADLSADLPRMTAGELARLRALGRAMRRERLGHYRPTTLAEEVRPVVDAAALLVESLSHLDNVAGVADALAGLTDDQSMALDAEDRATLARSVRAVAACIDALLGLDGPRLATLRRAVDGALDDPPT